MDVEGRFWGKVQVTDGCWLWTAGTDGKGYGKFHLDGRARRAHRVSYEWTIGPIPPGLTLDHLCRNRACVRPSHLEPVGQAENTRRSPMAPTTVNAGKTRCPKGHPYDEINTYLGRRSDGSHFRVCRACRVEHRLAYAERRRSRRALSGAAARAITNNSYDGEDQ